MAPPNFHFAIGAFVGFIAILFFIPFKKKWLIYLPFVVTLFGFLALMPDIGKYGKVPIIQDLISDDLTFDLHQEKFNTLFFYHPYLDHNKDKYESSETLEEFGYLAIVTLFSLSSGIYILLTKGYYND
jgi:hypothetical protein